MSFGLRNLKGGPMKFILAKIFGAGSLSKIAPVFGAIAFIAAVQMDNSVWVEFWRLSLTFCIGIIGTLCGVVYHDFDRRMKEDKDAQKMMHKENQVAIDKVVAKQNQIIGAFMGLAMVLSKAGNVEVDRTLETLERLLR